MMTHVGSLVVVLSFWGFEKKVKARVPKELKISVISKKKVLCNNKIS